MAETDDYDQHEDPGGFRDQLRQRDRVIAELGGELDEANDLIRRLREHAEDYTNSIESWCETFGMEMTEDDLWTWQPFWDKHWELVDRWNALVRDWNRMITLADDLRDVGRPLAASEAEAAYVLKLHRQGKSLRAIADETSLSLRTVRTIIGRANFTDRTSRKRRKIAIDQHERAHWKAQRRTGDVLPKQVEKVIETGKALVKEAKGLGRAR